MRTQIHKQAYIKSHKLLSQTLLLTIIGTGIQGLAGCKGNGGDTKAVIPVKSAVPTPTQVSFTLAHTGPITLIQPVTGALSAQNDVTVGAKLAGKIVFVYFREGDAVRKNQIVVQQDPADLQAQLDQQRANLASAQTRLTQAKTTLENAKTTLQLTQKQTSSAVAEARAALDAARQQLAVVKNGARAQERQQAQGNVTQAIADRESARADLVSSQADAERAQADLRRYQKLFAQNAIPAQQIDQAKAVAESAAAHVSASQARVNSADAHVKNQQEALSLTLEGSRTEDVQRAQAAVEQANQQYLSAQANLSQVNLRRSDVDTASAGIINAQAGVQQAQAAVRLATQGVDDTAIRSPIDGVVAERKVEPGQQVAISKDVMRIVALDSIYFDAQLPEALYAKLAPQSGHAGKIVSLQVSAFPNHPFRGTVSKIFPVASSVARNFTVRIQLQNEGNILRPQMFARGEVVLDTHPHAVLVPRDAVLDNTGTTGRVFLVKSKVAKEQKIKVGYSNLKEIEITSGVQAGDQVVTQGQAQLQDGSSVLILAP